MGGERQLELAFLDERPQRALSGRREQDVSVVARELNRDAVE
jgi:hypothetical protein